jgi:hypothetical protein
VLRIEILVNILVELLIGTGGFGCIKVTAASDIAIRCVEIQRACDGLEIVNW